MSYLIIVILLIGIVYYYFFVHRKKALLKEMVSAIDMVIAGVYERLYLRYIDKYGKEESAQLAAAVTNELFSNNPSNAAGEKYLELNKKNIIDELKELQNDIELCDMITQAIRVKVTVAYAKNINDKDSLIKPIEKLKEFGILMPGGEMPSPSTFLPKAYEFYKSAKGSS